MALICFVGFAAGVAFWLKGAWPVMSFFGLAVILINAAFGFSYCSGRLAETVELTARRLTITRRRPDGGTRV